MALLSIIIPSYNEENNIKNTSKVIQNILDNNNINYEILFVNDGSGDCTYQYIEDEVKSNERVVGINFSRNFGKEACIFAGLEHARGDCCVVIDCDLQHPPEVIVEMYRLWEQGFEIVEGIKKSRGKENFLYKIFAKTFYGTMKSKMNCNSSDFKLLDRKVIDALNNLTEKNTFFRALSFWVGFKTTSIEFEVKDRLFGETKWNFKSLIKYAIKNITSFTAMPLQFITMIGSIFIAFAVIIGVQTIVKYFMGKSIEGFTTVILLILITGGCIMIALGIIGYYIKMLFDEIKARPRYIVTNISRNTNISNKNFNLGE